MQIDVKFRRAVLKKLAILRAIPDISVDSIAEHCLILAYRHAKNDLISYWQHKMDRALLHDEMGQAIGVLRNVYVNMLLEIDATKARGVKLGKYDVGLTND